MVVLVSIEGSTKPWRPEGFTSCVALQSLVSSVAPFVAPAAGRQHAPLCSAPLGVQQQQQVWPQQLTDAVLPCGLGSRYFSEFAIARAAPWFQITGSISGVW